MSTTHVLMVTDMSGSMALLASDVRDGFNGYLDELRTSDADFRISVVLFDTEIDMLCMDARLTDVPRLTRRNYTPAGGTALYDAIGSTAASFDRRVPDLLETADRVLMVIQTDGAENSSMLYSGREIRKLIADKEATGRWSFIFLGAGLSAFREGRNLGLRADQLLRTENTGKSVRDTYSGLSVATRAYSRGATGAETCAIVAGELGSGSTST